jgi:hypothetical protein
MDARDVAMRIGCLTHEFRPYILHQTSFICFEKESAYAISG